MIMDIEHEKGFNANQLKLIAIAAMTLDHLVWTLFPGYNTEWYVLVFHMIGRLTDPIMWFFIAEGYHYTHDVKKYAGRLFLLAAISHFAYNLWTLMYAAVYFVFIDKVYAFIQLFTCLTIPLLWLYNGKRGSMKGIGKLFYIYYPLHLFICGIIRILLWGAGFSTGTANF
jgi:hypothetical protein|nr:TraX family protein [uncultured Acetatifactor sp.]